MQTNSKVRVTGGPKPTLGLTGEVIRVYDDGGQFPYRVQFDEDGTYGCFNGNELEVLT